MDRRTTATVAAVAAAVAMSLVSCAVSLGCVASDGRSAAGPAFNSAVVLAFAVVGAVVAATRPRNIVGWFMLAGGVTWAAGGAAVDVAYHGIVASPGAVAGASAFAVAGSAVRSVGWYLVTLAVPLYFPDGRLAGPRWRWLGPALVVVLVGAVVDPFTDGSADLTNFGSWQNPLGTNPVAHAASALAFLAHLPFGLVLTMAAVAQLVHRWRRGDAFERQQLTLFGAAALPLPFAIGFAVLARGLYDLRTAANRTLVWLTLSAVVAGAYALVIAGVGSTLHVDRHETWLPWAAAGVVAVSFAPLRDSLQRGINRVTYGRWDQPYDVLAALGQRVEATADLTRLLADVVTELAGLGLRDVAILDLRGDVVAGSGAEGTEGTEVEALALAAYGEPVGALRYRTPVTPLRRRDRQLLEDLAGQLGAVLHAHRLTGDLQAARERLVLAREEERRRLRRDLHDGLGPALAGHLLRLDVISARVAGGAAAADVELLRGDLRTTIADVRRVVEGLRPPALDELGLRGALEQVTKRLAGGTATAVIVDAEDLPALSAAVEVAAFRIVTEAVTNVLKHAAATTCHIGLTAGHGRLCISVVDDGCGIPPVRQRSDGRAGHGLQTMRERAEELRGRLTVARRRAGGTAVTAELPLPPAQRHAATAARAGIP